MNDVRRYLYESSYYPNVEGALMRLGQAVDMIRGALERAG
jgi:hypothetical protein